MVTGSLEDLMISWTSVFSTMPSTCEWSTLALLWQWWLDGLLVPRTGIPKQGVLDHHAEGSSQKVSEVGLRASRVSCMCQPWPLLLR